MTTIDPRAFIAVETAVDRALMRGWSAALEGVAEHLHELIETRQYHAAYAFIDTVKLDGVADAQREQLMELGVSAALFGAAQVENDLDAVTTLTTPPPQIAAALDQLENTMRLSTAEQTRVILRSLVAEAEEAARELLYKDDMSSADLAAGGLATPEQGLGARTLYVHRPLLNGRDIIQWAEAAGLTSTLQPDDLHVTICFSRSPLDWGTIPADTTFHTSEGGKRYLARFGRALVLGFEDPALTARHEAFSEAGASYDFDEYRAHVTITYNTEGVDLAALEPYTGPLEFGPEDYSELNLSWADKIEETELRKAEPKSLADRLNDAVLRGRGLVNLSANLTTSRLVTFGYLSEAMEKGVTTYQVNEVLDSRTCAVCQTMHGKRFQVAQEYVKVMAALQTSDAAELRSLAPWPRNTKDAVEALRSTPDHQLQSMGYGSPPYHPLCRGYLTAEGTVTQTIPSAPRDAEIDDLVLMRIQGIKPSTPVEVEVPVIVPVAPWSLPEEALVGYIIDNANLLLRGSPRSLSRVQGDHANVPGFVPDTVNDAVELYTGGGFRAINTALREQAADGIPVPSDIAGHVTAIRSVMHTSEHPMVAFRGVPVTGQARAYDFLEPGDVIEEAAFVSTSRSAAVALDFIEGSETEVNIMFRLRLPTGTRMLVTNPREAELVLPPGSTLRVISVQTPETSVEWGYSQVTKIIEVEVLQ